MPARRRRRPRSWASPRSPSSSGGNLSAAEASNSQTLSLADETEDQCLTEPAPPPPATRQWPSSTPPSRCRRHTRAAHSALGEKCVRRTKGGGVQSPVQKKSKHVISN